MVTGSRSKSFVCRGIGVLMVVVLATWVFAPAVFAQNCADVPPDRSIRDCNGNGIDDADDITYSTSEDTDGDLIPDECDFQICRYLWDGFQADPPFVLNGGVDGIDYDGDGVAWDDPEGKTTVKTGGCEPGVTGDHKLRTTSPSEDPQDAFLVSEYFRIVEGELDCGGTIHSLTFSAVMDYNGDSKYDWHFFVYDAHSGEASVQIVFASTEGTIGAEGYVPGEILVWNADETYTTTGVAITEDVCYELEVVLDNTAAVEAAVKVYVDGELKVTTGRLEENARRMDYFHLEPAESSTVTTTASRLVLDAFWYCVTGPALMNWTDCNNNCVGDDSDIANEIVEDCNANGVPDTCDGVQNCSCDGDAVTDSCIPCNHDHHWDFEDFELGSVACENGWTVLPPDKPEKGQIVNTNGGDGGLDITHMLKLDTFVLAQPYPGIRGPRTRDEQPGNPYSTDDAGIEFWEADIVISTTDTAGEAYFIIWDECENSFVNDDNEGRPECRLIDEDHDGPTCILIEEGEDKMNTYAHFNVGIRFTYSYYCCPPLHDLRLQNLLNGEWEPIVNQYNGVWAPGEAFHINIRIDNWPPPPSHPGVYYWANVHEAGQQDTLDITVQVPNQYENPNGPGDRQVMMLNRSLISKAYFDNLKYTTDSNCDRDTIPDSYYLHGGSEVEPGDNHDTNSNGVLDWCEDCNQNCVVDADDISGPTSEDCNSNGIPDECDVNPDLPLYQQWSACTGPWDVPTSPWSRYTRQGGGSLDSNTNGIPDDCEEDCNGNGMLDSCEIDCDDPLCPVPPAGCGEATDCNGNDIPDDCEPDCNENGFADECDISGVTSLDCNINGVPDECEEDCNGNSIPDECDITAGTAQDCDENGIIDQCEVSADCNANWIHDLCDIDAGTSEDTNGNGVPDECEDEEPGCRYIYDLDNTCFVDATDLGLFAVCWLLSDDGPGWSENNCVDKDFDCSGTVDATDLGLFAGAWLKDHTQIDPTAYPDCQYCEGDVICPWPE